MNVWKEIGTGYLPIASILFAPFLWLIIYSISTAYTLAEISEKQTPLTKPT